MWKKEEESAKSPGQRPQTSPGPERKGTERGAVSANRATIGRSIRIKGEVTGDEDLLIQGRVDGSVDLKQHSVTVGSGGEVKASITGRVIIVEGKVEGDITAEEQVVLRSTAKVDGDLTAPRVVLEDGARFRGGVDMGDPARQGSPTQPREPREPGQGSPEPATELPAGQGKRSQDRETEKEKATSTSQKTPAEVKT